MVKILRFQTYSPLGRLYQKAGLPEKIRRSLNIIILANVFGTIHAIICGGGTSTMIGFANSLGAGDLVFGLLAGLPQAASLFQLPFAVLVSAKQKRKRYMLTYGLVSRVLWLFFGFIPLVVPKHPAYLQIFSLIFLLGISSGLGAVINVCWFPWLSDLTPLSIRGRWMGFREMLLALTNILFSLLVAFLLDNLPPQSRYLIIFAVGGDSGRAGHGVLQVCGGGVYRPAPPNEAWKNLGGRFFQQAFYALAADVDGLVLYHQPGRSLPDPLCPERDGPELYADHGLWHPVRGDSHHCDHALVGENPGQARPSARHASRDDRRFPGCFFLFAGPAGKRSSCFSP